MNVEDPFEEDEETESSGDEESSFDGSVFDVNEYYNGYGYYNDLLSQLRRNQCSFVQLEFQGVLDLILDNVDEFCRVLSHSQGIKEVSLGGDVLNPTFQGSKLELTAENATSWNALLQTVGRIGSLEKVSIGVDSFNPSIMNMLLQAVPDVAEIELSSKSLHEANGEDMRPFVEALSNHSCESISISLSDRLGEAHSLEPVNRLEDHGVLSELLRLETVVYLNIEYSELSLEECRSFADILASNTCRIKELRLFNCSFLDKNDESSLGNALGSNQSLNKVQVWATSIHDTLVSSIAQSTSIKEIFLCETEWASLNGDEVDVVNLIRSVASQNTAIESMTLNGLRYALDHKHVRELQQHVEQNYTLQHVNIQYRQPFATITRLNAAGRRYLREDPNNNSKCIAVLAKTKDDLDCLYCHMRENPILCMSYCSNTSSSLSGNKRKAYTLESPTLRSRSMN